MWVLVTSPVVPEGFKGRRKTAQNPIYGVHFGWDTSCAGMYKYLPRNSLVFIPTRRRSRHGPAADFGEAAPPAPPAPPAPLLPLGRFPRLVQRSSPVRSPAPVAVPAAGNKELFMGRTAGALCEEPRSDTHLRRVLCAE